MKKYYIHADEATNDSFNATINGHAAFSTGGIIGNVNGVPAPDNARTTNWCEKGRELLDGRWATPIIPNARLDAAGISQAERDGVLSAFNTVIEEVEDSAFVPIVSEEE